ncbi:MAG: hypothetical protein P8Y93_09220 [Acidobacteriota bacterium]
MRLIRLTFSLFYDPYWFANFRRSWKTRRFWLAAPSRKALSGRTLNLQVGPLTFTLYIQGPATREIIE